MTHERFEGERTLMRIHIGESDKWHGKPLYEGIVERHGGRRADHARKGAGYFIPRGQESNSLAEFAGFSLSAIGFCRVPCLPRRPFPFVREHQFLTAL